ncbi:MAG TPA: class I adenylate-forming enzyme family protein [Aestuariivirgaceae bacterium]|nr:class I adenylate-forming enzyme family protein [Aestuariivirgaceae bacterium]
MSTPEQHPWLQLEALAARRGDDPALIFPERNRRLSFMQWRGLSLRLAGGLLALGLKPGDHIGLLAENRIEWPVVQLAVAAMGGVLVPLNTFFRHDDLGFALRQSQSKAVILSREFRSNPYLDHVQALRPTLPQLAHIICLDNAPEVMLLDDILSEADLPARVTLEMSKPAALLYTSGTTGLPKGALLSHRAMAFVARTATLRLGIGESDKWTSMIPLFHCAGCIFNLLGSLSSGACYVGVSHFDPELMFEIIEGERATIFSGVPTGYHAMLHHPTRVRYDLSTLRGGTCGGAQCNPGMLRQCAQEFPMPGLAQVYGQTECATLFTAAAPDDPDRFETAGLPLPPCELRIVEPDTGEALASGEVGEIQGSGPNVMIGYFDDAEASALALTGDRFLRTGDRGYLTPSGKLVIAGGRLKDMVIRGGENISPAEIEDLLQDHPAVVSAAVFGMPDEYYGEVVVAALMLEREITARELNGFCSQHIAQFKVPIRYYITDVFPLTASGKVRKMELKEWAKENRMDVLQ